MNDLLQVVIVTAVAGFALVTILRPYFRRRSAQATSCANCAAGAAAARRQPQRSQPLTVFPTAKPR